MNVAVDADRWIFAQIGARQRYFIPRALAAVGALEMLLTDAWYAPGHPLARTRRLKGRFNKALTDVPVWTPGLGGLVAEGLQRLRGGTAIETIMARNAWFQRAAVRNLERLPDGPPRILSSFSYAARDLFAHAKRRGWRTVLNQIDPGPFEEELVQSLHEGMPLPTWPPRYWADWRVETELADRIVVNSNWSREALIAQSVPVEKIHVIPLVFDGVAKVLPPRTYPATFTTERPMRVLFLGQIIARKGVLPLFEAIRRIGVATPIQFDFVGPIDIDVPADMAADPRVFLHGSIPQAEADRFYDTADVFILPTFSDGFGVTQIEARAMRLPVIASRQCGDVVRHGVNGLLLDAVSPEAIVSALLRCVHDPKMLARMAAIEDVVPNEADIGRQWTGVFDS